ncbi:MAG: HD domain-containing protein [Chloroflexi bacterium]|nr:HD domain-containing protein [Chloroflexota bacterium]MBV9547672.1 HD domain-containing protein [Chloroflexota bacterium]
MTSSTNTDALGPQAIEHAEQDPVISALRQAEASYRQTIAALQSELDDERRRQRRDHASAESLTATVHEMLRSMFSGNVFDLVLKTCVTLTGATRGLFISAGDHERLRVRAAIDVDGYPSAPPSRFIIAICRAVLDTERVWTCNDLSALPEPPSEGEHLQSCLAAPVVLRGTLEGIVIVADKVSGEFDDRDADLLVSVGNHAGVAVENSRLQREVQEAYLSIVTVLAETMAARNQLEHSYRDSGARIARVLAERLGASEYDQSVTYYAALLHDVGNIGVSDGVLNKPGPLLDAERELIRTHAQMGHDLLRQIPILDVVARIVRHHHERYDGTGYPDGLKDDEIPLPARIVAVVDAFESMMAPRSYRPALSEGDACEQLRRGAGSQFDPRVVEAFLAVLNADKARTAQSGGRIEDVVPGLELLTAQVSSVATSEHGQVIGPL